MQHNGAPLREPLLQPFAGAEPEYLGSPYILGPPPLITPPSRSVQHVMVMPMMVDAPRWRGGIFACCGADDFLCLLCELCDCASRVHRHRMTFCIFCSASSAPHRRVLLSERPLRNAMRLRLPVLRFCTQPTARLVALVRGSAVDVLSSGVRCKVYSCVTLGAEKRCPAQRVRPSELQPSRVARTPAGSCR